MSKDASTVIVFAGSATEAALVRSLLETAGIAAHLDDEHIGTTAPHIASGGGANAVKVKVADSDAVKASELLASRAEDA